MWHKDIITIPTEHYNYNVCIFVNICVVHQLENVSLVINHAVSYTNQPTSKVISDASGNWGCGAFTGDQWFQLEWTGMLHDIHISIKELTPIIITVAIWGKDWHRHKV